MFIKLNVCAYETNSKNCFPANIRNLLDMDNPDFVSTLITVNVTSRYQCSSNWQMFLWWMVGTRPVWTRVTLRSPWLEYSKVTFIAVCTSTAFDSFQSQNYSFWRLVVHSIILKSYWILSRVFALLSTHKQLEMHGCVLSTVVTDGLVLKRQFISIKSAERILIVLDQFHWKIIYVRIMIIKYNIKFRRKNTQ